MPIEDPIEPNLELRLQTERLLRTINTCQDIDILRGIAIELLRLHEKKSAIAKWATKRAAEAELTTIHDVQKINNESYIE